ncbi:MAG: AAA family ATPase, partial [Candidatus Omnitrophota bacterium]
MNEEINLKEIPYGLSDFDLVRKDNYYYVDKTRFIKNIEKKGRYLFFIRPRRFGKSLFLSIMESYYDIDLKDQFDDLFSGTDIHKEPTSERNQYMVLKFNFAMIEPAPANVEEAFLENIRDQVIYFITKYQKYLDIDIDKVQNRFQSIKSASIIMGALLNYCLGKEKKLYVIIDEYDNFANTILTSSGQQSYHDITHGEGFLRSFFNVVKGGTTGSRAPISRLFMTGVSPITLDEVASGFNIAANISLDSDINEILGLTFEEVETMVDYYRQTGKIRHSTPELMALMSQWYNHYRFS